MKNVLLIFYLLLICSFASAQKTNYGGGKHTYSHGGYYKNGSGSSHKGGTYKNANTNNRYGTHKTPSYSTSPKRRKK